MKKALGTLALLTLMISPTFAKNKGGSKGKEKPASSYILRKYVQKASQLTGKKYLYSKTLKGTVHHSKNLKWTKENADVLLSHILNENGYTRVPVKGEDAYRIIDARDVRYNSTPFIHANKSNPPNLPDTADYYMMSYTFGEDTEFGITTGVTRSFRPFMSRYGRIIDNKRQKKIIIQDTALNIKRLYKLIKDIDVKPSSDFLKKQKEKREHSMKLELLQAEHCPPTEGK